LYINRAPPTKPALSPEDPGPDPGPDPDPDPDPEVWLSPHVPAQPPLRPVATLSSW